MRNEMPFYRSDSRDRDLRNELLRSIACEREIYLKNK